MKSSYRGYLICSSFTGRVWVEKDRCHIAYASTVEEARATIDALLAP
jgi:hypothetical protein